MAVGMNALHDDPEPTANCASLRCRLCGAAASGCLPSCIECGTSLNEEPRLPVWLKAVVGCASALAGLALLL